MRVYKEFFFEAAHLLPSAAPGHPNSRVHGHSFRARVTIDGEPDADDRRAAPFRRHRGCGRRGARRARPSLPQRRRGTSNRRRSSASPSGCGIACTTGCLVLPRFRSRAIAVMRAASILDRGAISARARRSRRNGGEEAIKAEAEAARQADADPRIAGRCAARARGQSASRDALCRPLHRAGVHLPLPDHRPA